MLISRLRDSRL